MKSTITNIRRILTGTPWLIIEGFKIHSGEGYKHGKFGTKLGIDHSVDAVYHDVAHLIEFYLSKPQRLGFHRIEFQYNQIEVFGENYDSPQTAEACLRECRTIAIQAHLMISNHLTNYTYDEIVNQWIRSLYLMEDFLNLPAKVKGTIELEKESRTAWLREYTKLYFDSVSTEQLIKTWPLALNKLLTSNRFDAVP